MSFSLLKPCIPLRTSPKKSKKRQAKILLLKIRSTPIALAALPADFFSSGSSPRLRRQFLPYVIFALKTLHSAADIPKKVEKTSSENTAFEISEHPYRTCGSSGCVFILFGSSPMSVFLWKTYDFLNILVQSFDFLVTIALAALPSVFSSSSVPPLCQFSFGKPMIF